jgi:hypothetical protein
MAIQMISAQNVQLIEVIDLRPIDFQSGKRLAIPANECNVCDRCGKLHVKIYVVEADGCMYKVGSGCCKRLFGWEPTREAVLTAEKIDKDRAVQAALRVVAQPIIDQVNAIPVPELRYHSFRWTCFGYDYIWTVPGNDKIGIRVESRSSQIKEVKDIVLTDADRERFARVWKRRQVKEIIDQLYADDAKTAKKLIFAIKQMMDIAE